MFESCHDLVNTTRNKHRALSQLEATAVSLSFLSVAHHAQVLYLYHQGQCVSLSSFFIMFEGMSHKVHKREIFFFSFLLLAFA